MKTFSLAIIVIALLAIGCDSKPISNESEVEIAQATVLPPVFKSQIVEPSSSLLVPDKMYVSEFESEIGKAENHFLDEYAKGTDYWFVYARFVIEVIAEGKEYEINVDGFDHTQDMNKADVFPDKIAAMKKVYDQVMEKSPDSFILVLNENGRPYALDMEESKQENEDGKVGKLILTKNVWNSLSDFF